METNQGLTYDAESSLYRVTHRIISMRKRNNLLYSLLALGTWIAFPSCRAEAPERTEQAPVEQAITSGVQITLPLDITATTEVKKAQSPRSANMPFDLVEDDKLLVIPSIAEDNLQTFTSVIVLANKTTGKKYVGTGSWVQEQSDEIKKTYRLTAVTVPKEAEEVTYSTGEWYMLALTGAGDPKYKTTGSSLPNRLEVRTDTILTPVVEGATLRRVAPFITNWRRLVWDTSQGKDKGFARLESKNQPMVFRTPGAFIVLRGQNYMTMGVRVNRTMTLESNGYAARGYYDFDAIQTKDITNDQSFGSKYWVTQSQQTAASREGGNLFNISDFDATATKPHYSTAITLQAGIGESDREWYHLGKRTGTSPVSSDKLYVLYLMRIMDEPAYKNIIYANAEVEEASRTHFTTDEATYTSGDSPDTWKPYLGKKYIIASFNDLASGTSNLLNLRTIRPMLPIEHIWPRVGAQLGSNPQATYAAWFNSEGTKDGILNGSYLPTNSFFGNGFGLPETNKYPDRWRIPYVNELATLIRNPIGYLQNYSAPSNGLLESFSYKIPDTEFPREAGIDDNLRSLSGHISAYYSRNNVANRAGGTMLSLRYGWYEPTSTPTTKNYYVAIRFTWGLRNVYPTTTLASDWYYAKIETAYLGPNFNPQDAIAGGLPRQFIMSDAWWKYNVDPDAIITRYIPYDISGYYYWTQPFRAREARNNQGVASSDPLYNVIYYLLDPNGQEFTWTHISNIPFTEVYGDNTTRQKPTQSFIIPWLAKPAW